MPRAPRLLLSRSYYHVITRGNNHHQVFESDDDYFYYLELIKRYKSELPFSLYHYCLMPNHVHMLVQTKNAAKFSLFMKKINLAYFHHYRQNYGWVGHFWQDRYRSQAVGKDDYFIQCGKYIELNPVRAKMVKKPEDYPYSSYRYYVEGKKDDLITPDMIYLAHSDDSKTRQEHYRKMIIGEPVRSSYPKAIWGSSQQRYGERNKASKYFARHNKIQKKVKKT